MPEAAILEHEALISAIYAGAAGETDWDMIPKAICESFEGRSMLFADGYFSDPGSFRVCRWNLCDEMIADSGLTLADHFDPDFNAGFAACLRAPLNTSFLGAPYYYNGTERNREFFDRFFAKRDMIHERAFTVIRDGNAGAGGFIARPTSAGPMTAIEVARFDGLLTHLRRAIDMRQRLEIGRTAQDSFASIIDHQATGVLLVDRYLRILFRNSVAEAMLEKADGVSARSGCLRLNDPAAHACLLARLRGLYAVGSVSTETPIPVRRIDCQPPLSVSAYRAVGTSASTGAHAAYACILVGDPLEGRRLPTSKKLEVALGLTSAEAKVVRLTPLALSNRQMAARLGVAESTVKTHLAHACDKLGARSKALLGQIVSRVGMR